MSQRYSSKCYAQGLGYTFLLLIILLAYIQFFGGSIAPKTNYEVKDSSSSDFESKLIGGIVRFDRLMHVIFCTS